MSDSFPDTYWGPHLDHYHTIGTNPQQSNLLTLMLSSLPWTDLTTTIFRLIAVRPSTPHLKLLPSEEALWIRF